MPNHFIFSVACDNMTETLVTSIDFTLKNNCIMSCSWKGLRGWRLTCPGDKSILTPPHCFQNKKFFLSFFSFSEIFRFPFYFLSKIDVYMHAHVDVFSVPFLPFPKHDFLSEPLTKFPRLVAQKKTLIDLTSSFETSRRISTFVTNEKKNWSNESRGKK